MRLDRYFMGALLLLTLVIRSAAGTPTDCARFTLESLDHGEQWTVCACGPDADAVQMADSVHFLVTAKEPVNSLTAEQSTAGAMLEDHADATSNCWQFTLFTLNGRFLRIETACGAAAQAIRDLDGVNYIIVEEMAM
jgi:hypothetical protein